MTRPSVHVIWLALLILALASCAPQPTTLTVGAAQSGATIDLRTGDTVVVALESNPSTGFDWVLVGPAAPALDSGQRTYASSGTALGAPGTVTYRFRAVAEGTTRLVMHYLRSWESLPPERTFELTVRVSRG
jgi:inhibitor of cysteine peptidase